MLLSQRPLSAAPQDTILATTAARTVAARVVRNIGRGRNTLVLGPRGSGRSSILSLIERFLADENRTGARLDAGPVDDLGALVDVVRARLGDDPRGPRIINEPGETFEEFVRRSGDIASAFRPRGPTSREEPRGFNETDVLRLVSSARRAKTGDASVVVLLDNLSPMLASDFFGRYRDTLWAAPIVWVAAGDADRNGYLDPPADVFWEAVEWLEPLGREDVADLVQRRLHAAAAGDDDALAIQGLERQLADDLQGSTPREVIRRLAEVADARGDVASRSLTSERVGAAHLAGGRRAAMLLAELEALGRPVHAGDDELLARMGLTRPRIVQLLTKLEGAGLVARHRVGRRVLYETTS